jgi:hypothetical protein
MTTAGEPKDSLASAMLTEHQIQALSNAFSDRTAAVEILSRAGFPPNRIPDWTSQNSLTFWRNVNVEILHGVLSSHGNRRVLAAAAESYPGNPQFSAFAGWQSADSQRSIGAAADEMVNPKKIGRLQRAIAKLTECAGIVGLPEPVNWTLQEIEALRDTANDPGCSLSPQAQEYADNLIALCDRLIVEPILHKIDARSVPLGKLKVVYRLEVRSTQSRWPTGESVWPMVEEAAKAALVERADPLAVGPLDSLERFILAIAADWIVETGVDASGSEKTNIMAELCQWVDSREHSSAEAQRYLASCMRRKTWLVIDLGDEPLVAGAPLWPGRQLTARLYQTGDATRMEPVKFGPVTCDRENDFEASLEILLCNLGSLRVFVDILAPRPLLDWDIRKLKILPRGGAGPGRMTSQHRVRMRWSQRWSDESTFRRLRQMANEVADWKNPSPYLPSTHSNNRDSVREWLDEHEEHPVLVAASGDSDFDILWEILQDGRGFVVWFPEGADQEEIITVLETYSEIPWISRRNALPDELGNLPEDRKIKSRHVIIWDDPNGREGISLSGQWPVLQDPYS